jgi:hypothetical protein
VVTNKISFPAGIRTPYHPACILVIVFCTLSGSNNNNNNNNNNNSNNNNNNNTIGPKKIKKDSILKNSEMKETVFVSQSHTKLEN